jgi:RNA methyltransferase, TrmH family
VAIASRRHPIVARYRAAARGDVPDVVLLDGARLVADALHAGVPLRHAVLTHEAAERERPLLAALAAAGTETEVVSARVMEAASPVKTSTGIVALAARPETGSGPRLYAGAAPLVVIAVDVQDPGNVGAIARVAEAAGATAMVAAGGSADPFGWKALRGSMGSSLRLPIARMGAGDAIADARRHHCRIVAAAPRGGRPLTDADLTPATAVVIGGEGGGLPPGLLAEADEQISIPMQPPVESLNAAVAAALIVYEARRQRTRHGQSVS